MMAGAAMTGVFPVLPTIFLEDGTVDRNGMANVVEYIAESGARGLVFPGLASEVETLDAEERVSLTRFVGNRLAGRLTYIVGASAATHAESVLFAKAGGEAGAAAAMVMTPRAAGVEALCEAYRALGEECGVPIMLQNAPAPMGLGLSVEEVARVVGDVGAVRWVKEETLPSGQRLARLCQTGGVDLDGAYGGAGGRYLIDELRRGALGTMPAAEISEVHVAMVARFQAGDEAGARDLFDRTLPLLSMQAIYRWRLTKEVLRRRGLIASAHVRAAGPTLDSGDHDELTILLDRIGDLLTVSPVIQPAPRRAA